MYDGVTNALAFEMSERAKNDRRQLNWAPLIHMQTGLPAMVVGMCGEAKTTTVKLVADCTNRYYANLSLSKYEAEDVGGYGVPTEESINGERIYFVRKVQLEQIAKCRVQPSVLCLDELGSVDERKQAAALQLLCDETGAYDSCWMLGCANPSEIAANGHDLSLPATNRLMITKWEVDMEAHQHGSRNRHKFPAPSIPIVPPREEWETNLDYWGCLKADYVDCGGRFRVDETEAEKMLSEGKPYTTPRSWTYFETFGAAAMSVGATNATIDKGMNGLIGEENAGMFRDHMNKVELPNPEHVIANARTYRLPDRSDLTRALLSSLSNYLRHYGGVSEWEAVCDMIEGNYHTNKEWIHMWYGEFVKCKPVDHKPERRMGSAWRELINDRVEIAEARKMARSY
jgi:hypothetical protein